MLVLALKQLCDDNTYTGLLDCGLNERWMAQQTYKCIYALLQHSLHLALSVRTKLLMTHACLCQS